MKQRQFIEFTKAYDNKRILLDVSDIRAYSEQKSGETIIYFYSDNKTKEVIKETYDVIIDRLSKLNF